MATNDPDPLSFENWEDAFQYPVPAVRRFEQQLRQHAEENRHMLRNLVGVSYRDLLGTAERIIDMADQIQHVEVTLGETGQRCNSRAVERLFSNYSTYRNDAASRKQDEYRLASELAMLRDCPTVISRLLKRNDSSLLAAKVLLLARLTHMTLSKRNNAPPLIDSLYRRLISLRRKLLEAIDRRLSNLNTDATMLVEEMSAFSLATSSTPSDVLRHFHSVRLEAINRGLSAKRANHEDVLNAIKLYVRTLRESQIIFPKRLSDALARLRTQPLLQHKDVRATSELSLHLHERWISDELRTYTPWPRHDELTPNEAEKQLNAWANHALHTLLTGTDVLLNEYPRDPASHPEATDHPKIRTIMVLRKAVLQAWPWSVSQLPGLDPEDVINQLRHLFNRQLAAQAQQLENLISAFIAHIQALVKSTHSQSNKTPSTLWSPTLLATPLTAGAQAFKAAILALYNGQPPNESLTVAINLCTEHYETYLNRVSSVRAAIKAMRETRWDDSADDAYDDSDDTIDADEKQRLLSVEDPRELEHVLDEALDDATKALNDGLQSIVAHVVEGPVAKGDDAVPSTTIALLRILRTIQLRNVVSHLSGLSAGIAKPLHRHLASVAVEPVLTVLRVSLLRTQGRGTLVARTLWEGSPPLPVMPSPAVFRMVRAVEKRMEECGADVWSGGAVEEVKRVLSEEVGRIMSDAVTALERQRGEDETEGGDGHDGGEVDRDQDGRAEASRQADAADGGRRERLTQMLFDALYLQRATAVANASVDEKGKDLASAVDQLVKTTKHEETEVMRLTKSAAEYWRRTYLLFALLVG